MSFEQYYQDELSYLHEMGEVFSHAYPKLAPYLAQKGKDPDVERLLEAFAFMSGKIRQKLDDELPELTHNLHSLLWPNYLRPVPALSVLQFERIKSAITEKSTIRKGVEVDSVPVDATSCRFRTCYDVDIYPVSITDIASENKGSTTNLSVRFKLDSGVNFSQLRMNKLRLFLYGDMKSSFTLYQYLSHYLSDVNVKSAGDNSNQSFKLAGNTISRVGFSENEELFPYPDNSFIGFRLIQEYFSLTHKFLFLDLNNLQQLADFKDTDEFEVVFNFERLLGDFVRINKDSIRLNCTPISNIFSMDADPIRLDKQKYEYLVRPSSQHQSHFEIHSINKVTGWQQGARARRVYKPFVSFGHNIESDENGSDYYQLRVKPSVVANGADTFISFVQTGDNNDVFESSTVSMELSCTNSTLPEKLNVGDISIATGNSPEFATFKNILPVTPSTPAPLEKDMHWQLISNMSLNYLTFDNVESLRQLLSTYNFPAHFNRQATRSNELKMQGLVSVKQIPSTLLIKGQPVSGYKTEIEMRSGNYSSEGEMYLFACVIQEVLAYFSAINTFTQLVVMDLDKVEEYTWPPITGQNLC